MIDEQPILEDPYCMDFRSAVAPDRLERNPLLVATPRRTHVVLVVLESVGAVYVDERPAAMPYLEGLGRSPGGLAFHQHYAPWAATMKAVFSLMCSEMPYSDYPPITVVNPRIPCTSLSEALAAAGYSTALITSQDLGYDRQMRFFEGRRFDTVYDVHSMPGRDGAWSNTWGLDDTVTVRAAVSHLAARARSEPDRPVFVTLNLVAGHHPYELPGGRRPADTTVAAEREAYRDTLSFVDERLRQLTDGLAAAGLADDTLVAVVSDHGEAFLQHGGRSHGGLAHEEDVRVPFVVVGPQLAGVTGAADFPTTHLDVAPTILGLLGVTPPATMKGRDLTRDREARLVIMASRPPVEQLAVRDGRWKMIASGETGAVQLFDLRLDPEEQLDVAGEHPEIVGALHERARLWQAHARNLIERYADVLATHGRRCGAPAPAPTPGAR